MQMPFDDSDGPDPRPEDVATMVIHDGLTLEKAMNYFFLNDEGDAPEWNEADRQACLEEIERQKAGIAEAKDHDANHSSH